MSDAPRLLVAAVVVELPDDYEHADVRAAVERLKAAVNAAAGDARIREGWIGIEDAAIRALAAMGVPLADFGSSA